MRDIALNSKPELPHEDPLCDKLKAVEGEIQARILGVDPSRDPFHFGFLMSLAGRVTDMRGQTICHLAARKRAA